MKLVEKIKKGLIGIASFLFTLPTKVFALDIDPLYAPPNPEPEPVKSTFINNVWNIGKILIIPLILLIGIIIYLKKSKSSIKKKLLVTIVIIAITVILYFVLKRWYLC